MRNVADLRLKNKLDKLWPKAAAMAQGAPASTGGTASMTHSIQ
jgi:hypothetical protein